MNERYIDPSEVVDANEEIVFEIERKIGSWVRQLEDNYDPELVEKAVQEFMKDRYSIKKNKKEKDVLFGGDE